MGTKSKWRGDKLAFYNAPMFVSAGVMTANVTATGTACKDETIIVNSPDYAANWTTGNNQHFKAVAGGVISSSSASCTFTLRRGTVDILALTIGGTKVQSTKVPFGVEFNGRLVDRDSSGKIAATGHAWVKWAGGTSEHYDGTTGGGTAYASTGHAMTTNSATGLNITFDFNTTGKTAIRATHGYIQFFEG